MGLGDLEDPGLGQVQDLFHLPLTLVVDVPDDLGGRVDQPPQEGLLAHDARVVLDVGRGRDRVEELRQELEATDAVELARLLQVLAHRDHVDHFAALEQSGHGPKEATMRLAEEHGVVDVLDRARHGVAVDQHPSQHRDLRLR